MYGINVEYSNGLVCCSANHITHSTELLKRTAVTYILSPPPKMKSVSFSEIPKTIGAANPLISCSWETCHPVYMCIQCHGVDNIIALGTFSFLLRYTPVLLPILFLHTYCYVYFNTRICIRDDLTSSWTCNWDIGGKFNTRQS